MTIPAEQPVNLPDPQVTARRRARADARYALREDAKLSGTAKLVWYTLDARGDDPHPSIATLAANCRACRGTVKRALRELEDAGWLRVTYRTTLGPPTPDTNRYELTCPHEGVGPSQTPPPADLGKHGTRRSEGGGSISDTTGRYPDGPTVGPSQTPEVEPEAEPSSRTGGPVPLDPPAGTYAAPDPAPGGTFPPDPAAPTRHNPQG